MSRVLPSTPDGAVSSKDFESARPRIVWLLKQIQDAEGTGWTELLEMLRTIADEGRIGSRQTQTWTPVARSSYGILHPEQPVRDWWDRPATYLPALRSIAVVNVIKTGGGMKTKDSDIQAEFARRGSSIQSEILELKPDIVIGGYVLWAAPWMPHPIDGRPRPPYKGYRLGSTTWVNANHPGQTKYKELDYYNGLLDAIRSHEVGKSGAPA